MISLLNEMRLVEQTSRRICRRLNHLHIKKEAKIMNTGGLTLKVEMDIVAKEVLFNEIRQYIEERLKSDSQLNNYRYLKKKELAELLNVSTQTVEKWMVMGLKYHQIDNLIIYNVKEVTEWLENYKKGGR